MVKVTDNPILLLLPPNYYYYPILRTVYIIYTLGVETKVSSRSPADFIEVCIISCPSKDNKIPSCFSSDLQSTTTSPEIVSCKKT